MGSYLVLSKLFLLSWSSSLKVCIDCILIFCTLCVSQTLLLGPKQTPSFTAWASCSGVREIEADLRIEARCVALSFPQTLWIGDLRLHVQSRPIPPTSNSTCQTVTAAPFLAMPACLKMHSPNNLSHV